MPFQSHKRECPELGYGSATAARLAPMGDSGGRAAPPRILVVDDEPSIRLLCRVNLELDGHEVVEAGTLAEARAAVDAGQVDVVVLDVHLHGERSDELVAECRSQRPPIPVLLVTGSADPTQGAIHGGRRDLAEAVRARRIPRDRPRARGSARRPMSATVVRGAHEYETAYRTYYFEASEEFRAVRVGEKETSEQAEIVERHADLFTPGQLEALRTAEAETAEPDERERLYRLRRTCEAGIVDAELAAREDELANALLAARLTFHGEELPLRAAEAQLAVLPDYAQREELGELVRTLDAGFNEPRRELLAARDAREAGLSGQPDAVARNEDEKQISLRELEGVLRRTADAAAEPYARLRDRWFERLLGPERAELPSSPHARWLRRLSPLSSTYTKERSVEVCVETVRALGFDLEAIPNIRLDLEDRPQKSPRACVIPSDPPEVVHLITRAQGGLADYASFLHEAGHALHYAGCDPRLPWTFRAVSRDHALTEIYSYIVEAVSREPGWHALHFDLPDAQAEENAEATVFLESFLFRRYAAKLRFELGFWDAFSSEQGGSSRDYEPLLTAATGLRYDGRGYLSDMDAGFYSADYLRAWIRSAQLRTHLRREVGEDWWRRSGTGEILGALFSEGTRPSTEDIARRLGFDPLDTDPLAAELNTA